MNVYFLFYRANGAQADGGLRHCATERGNKMRAHCATERGGVRCATDGAERCAHSQPALRSQARKMQAHYAALDHYTNQSATTRLSRQEVAQSATTSPNCSG